MSDDQPPLLPRVSGIQSPEAYTLPPRPEAASSAAQDAYRQTQFLLKSDLSLFADAMNLHVGLVQDAYPSKFRTHSVASVTALWSRVYSHLAAALELGHSGSYSATLPLIRAACEFIAAEMALLSGEQSAYEHWLAGTLRPDEEVKAFEFEMGHFFSGESLASDPVLRGIYRPASELARPNFGGTLLQVAPESNNTRLAIAFADRSFHLGWAEIVLGWLVALAVRQVRLIADAANVFPVAQDRRRMLDDLQTRLDTALERDDRCRIEEAEVGRNRRYLVHNFRRTSSASPKKVLL